MCHNFLNFKSNNMCHNFELCFESTFSVLIFTNKFKRHSYSY